MKKLVMCVVLVVSLSLGITACGSDSKKDSETTTTKKPAAAPTIAELAQSDKDFSQLLGYVDAAGLSYLLNSKGSFTVFAPTDAAFAKIDPATVEKLKANSTAMLNVLTYHAMILKVPTSKLTDGQKLTTVEGSSLTVGISGDTVTLTSELGVTATITEANIEASNGIIHKIDTVLLPADLEI